MNIGERLAMRGTAIGREASRMEAYGDSRAGPNREHVRREPFSDDPVPTSMYPYGAARKKRDTGTQRRRE